MVDARLACMGMEELIQQVSSDKRVKFLHFWGHAPRRDGSIGPSCLSQWWPSPFVVDGVRYADGGALDDGGQGTAVRRRGGRAAGAHGDQPGAAKRAGRLVRGFDDAIWERERFAIVRSGSVHKFGQHAELRDYLLGTGDRVLVEASPLDRVWGIGLAADDERAQDPARWRGLNLLGFALMEAREELRTRG